MPRLFPSGHVITTRDYRKPVKARHSRNVGPYCWTVPDAAERSEGRGFYLASKGMQVDPHGSSFDLRLSDANEHLAASRLSDTSGYFTGDDMSDTLKPIVARLPRSRGFLAGWTMGNGMASNLDTTTIHDTAEEAARAAHDMAERDAEHEREYQERESARLEEEERAEMLQTDAATLYAALCDGPPARYAELCDVATSEALTEAAKLARGDAMRFVVLARYLSTRELSHSQQYPSDHKPAAKEANRAAVATARLLGYSYPQSHAISF